MDLRVPDPCDQVLPSSIEGARRNEIQAGGSFENCDCIPSCGSKIMYLARTRGGKTIHHTLPPDGTSTAVNHRSVEETGHSIRGSGQVLLGKASREEIVKADPDTCVTSPGNTIPVP